jgi:serine/threonine-protein kinase
VHRDVKPGNVLITVDGQVKVADFGIARAIGQSETVTQTGLVMGTATYFSPEQAQGLGVDGRSDVYALGVVLYEMVTGRPPFTADTPVAIAYKHVSETAALPSEIEPRVPRDLEAIIMQAMAKQPQARYATAQDLHDDLERFMRGQPVLAAPPAVTTGVAQTTAVPTDQTLMLAATGPAVAPTTVQETVTAGGSPSGGGPTEYPKRRWMPWAAAAIVLLAALGAIGYFGGRSLGYFGGKVSLHVRDVQGMPYQKAESQLRNDGLVPSASFVIDATVVKGLVISQSPAANLIVKKGDSVHLTVSKGPPPPKLVYLPYVVTESGTQARGALVNAGFKVKTVYKAVSDQAIVGTVLYETPQSGTTYPVGSTVTLTVAKGVFVAIPSKGVVGESVATATTALDIEKFSVAFGRQSFSLTVPLGDVITTYPRPGVSVPQGSQVDLIVSLGPPATVPNVVLHTQAGAIRAIQNAHLNYQIVPVIKQGYLPGYVTDQLPAPGTQVSPHSTVTIDVEEEPATTTTSTTTTSTTTTTTSTTTTTTTTPTISGIS